MVYMDEVGLGQTLQEARQKAGLTQQDLCQKANLSYSTLAKIERGAIKSPSIFTIQSIADALGLSLDVLLGHTPPAGSGAGTGKHSSKSGIKFVYFDINGCLVRFFHHAFTKVAIDTGASSDAIESTFWHYNDQVCRGQMTLDDFNKEFAQALQVPSIDWKSYYMDAVDPITEMNELLSWAAQNYHVGLLSNIMPGFIDTMQKAGIIPDVDYTAVVDSSEVGAIKPEQKIYEIATAMANVPPAQILLVDDSRPNLMAAEKMGWKVLWFDGYRPDDSVAKVRSALQF
jgi:FMN phosphatase YigB (HAD superfamily)